MSTVQSEIDRVLTLLRNKIRERGFTQLEVQESLSWGRSYISQLLTKQKSLRIEQILLILNVIGVNPAEFYSELYRLNTPDRNSAVGDHGGRYPSAVGGSGFGLPEDHSRSFGELRALLRGLVRLLVDKNVINLDELSSVVKACKAGPGTGGGEWPMN